MPFKLLVYDLDGTLFETLPDLVTAVNRSLSIHGHPTRTPVEVRHAIGDGARILIARLVRPQTSESETNQVWDTFKDVYLEVCAQSSYLLPGTEAFLAARQQDATDRFQAILTNKPQAPSDRLAACFKMERWIGKVIGGDTELGKKPDPTGLIHLMDWANASAEQTLMIGDGPADLAVAQRAGVKCVLIDGGYGNSHELEGLPWEWKVANFDELAALWPEIEPS